VNDRGRRHRGLLIPGLCTLFGLAVLLGLGFWQVERLAWKENLIAALEQRVSAQPIPLPPSKEWSRLSQEDWEFRRVTATVERIEGVNYAYVHTAGSPLRPDVKAPGYFVFVPARLATGEVVVVNVGYDPGDKSYKWTTKKAEITGYLRWPEGPRWFVSESDASGTVWHVRDHRLMAERLGWGGGVPPFYIDQESPVPPGGLPRPGPLTVKLRNDHLGYAITWFGLAGVLVVIFGVWIARRQRIP
jgi:cytochrome oxidase assembly protein ShyY1